MGHVGGRMRYIRRWGVIPSVVPKELEILSLDAAGESVAAVRHTALPILGFQGHPEYSPEDISTQCLIAFFQLIDDYKNVQLSTSDEPSKLVRQRDGRICGFGPAQETANDFTKLGLVQQHNAAQENVTKQGGKKTTDLCGYWQLNGAACANVRDLPQGRGRRSNVISKMNRGSWIHVVKDLGNDWVSIGAPAEVKGLCTRLRHGSSDRVWSQIDAVLRSAEL